VAISAPTALFTPFADSVDRTTYTIASSFTPTANRAIFVYIANGHGTAGSNAKPTIGGTLGTTLTWTEEATVVNEGNNERGTLYSAQTGASPATGTITAIFSTAQSWCQAIGEYWAGADLSDPVVQVDTGATTNPDNPSLVLGALQSGAATAGYATWNSTTMMAAGSGMTAGQTTANSSSPTGISGSEYDVSSPSTTVGWTTTLNLQKLYIAVEVREAASTTRVTKTSTLSFDVRTRGAKAATLSYDVRARDSKSVGLVYDVWQRGTKTGTLSFDARNRGTFPKILSYNVRQRVDKTATLSFNVLQRITKDGTLSFDVQVSGSTRVTKTATLSFNTRGRVEKDATLSYDVRTRLETPDMALTFDVRQRGSKSGDLTFDVRERGSTDVTLSFDVRERVQADATLSYDVRLRNTRNATLSYDVLAEIVIAALGLWYSDGVTMQEILQVIEMPEA
jgi:hypothetical protein